MNKFNPVTVAESTISNKASKYYHCWLNLARYLDKQGYNAYEAEAILSSDIPAQAAEKYGFTKSKNYDRHTKWHLDRYLNAYFLSPGSNGMNEMVLKANPDLVANDKGVPCHKGRSAINPDAGEILVPVGTPACCDPTTETYWSM